MANIIEINDLTLPELTPYVSTNEIALKRWFEPKPGIFIAESPKVIRLALDSGYRPMSMLAERKYIGGQGADIIEKCGEINIYTADSSVITQLTGFRLTQGMLCAMYRQPLRSAEEICSKARRIAVLEDVMNQTNVGAVIRSAAALSFDAVLLTRPSSDPLYRRSIRVSMGNVFRIPWAYIDGESPEYVDKLRKMGFVTAAMALRHETLNIDDPRLKNIERLAVILGTEGEGLKSATIEACDYTVKIPMADGVDSLNVAAASAVAFWELR